MPPLSRVLILPLMRYETKNNIGFSLLFIGGLTIVFSLLFLGNTSAILGAILGVIICVVGGYMMTRSFTDIDTEHPDYEQYQARFGDKSDHRPN